MLEKSANISKNVTNIVFTPNWHKIEFSKFFYDSIIHCNNRCKIFKYLNLKNFRIYANFRLRKKSKLRLSIMVHHAAVRLPLLVTFVPSLLQQPPARVAACWWTKRNWQDLSKKWHLIKNCLKTVVITFTIDKMHNSMIKYKADYK